MNQFIALVFGSFFFAVTSFASNSVEAPGKVFYKMPNGEIVKREVSLVVPAMGAGEVVLKYGNKSVSTSHFKTVKRLGRTNFIVAFKDAPGAPAGAVAVFTGSYLRGTNAALYYGDIYSVTRSGNEEVELDALLDLDADTDTDSTKHSYAGGFSFKSVIK